MPDNSVLRTQEFYAALPFHLLEKMQLPSGYERSFKLSKNDISANRYLLGVDIKLLPEPHLTQLCKEMGMPEILQAELLRHKDSANLVLLGYDEQDTSPIHKIYLEFWDRLREAKKADPEIASPQLLHKGFKWQCNAPERHATTDYYCLPSLNFEQISNNIKLIFGKSSSAHSLAPILQILGMAHRRRPQAEFIYLQVSEAGSIRDSFDINLYGAELKVGEISEQILSAAIALHVPEQKMHRLMPLVVDKPLGHISAGIGRDGQEYFTIYYEQ